MTERDEREQQKAELLWRYIEELKQSENPEEVQFVAITHGECAEVVGLMETAAEAYVLTRKQSAPHCRREAIRHRLQAAIAEVPPVVTHPNPVGVAAPRSLTLPSWLIAPLDGRSTGWVVAVAVLVALLWFVIPRTERSPRVVPMDHRSAVAAIPRLVDGTLDAEKSRAVLAHLVECDGCMQLYLRLKAAHDASRPARQSRLPRVNMPVGPPQSSGANPPSASILRLLSVVWGR